MKKRCACALFLFLYGCGGGDAPVPPPVVNTPPSFTSLAAINVVENAPLSFQVAATDAQGQALTYAVAGGADAAAFSLTPNGLLTLSPRNFENPSDSDNDNTFRVTVSVSDGSLSSSQDIVVTVTNSREGVTVRRLFAGFTDPVAIAQISGDQRLLIAERDGSIWLVDTGANTRTLYMRVLIPDSLNGPQPLGAEGLLAMVPSPGFATDGRLFVAVVDTTRTVRVLEFRRPAVVGSASANAGPVLGFQNRGQITPAVWMGIGPDRELYVATGDSGGVNDAGNLVQDDRSFFGKLIRVRRNPDPFAGATVQDFLFDTIAKGFRAPAGGLFVGRDVLIGDRGQSRFGEINRMSISAAGLNFGWPFREGDVDNLPNPPAGLTNPQLQVAFGTGAKQGNAIAIGMVATVADPVAQSVLLFSDLNGSLWTVPTGALSGSVLGAAAFERRNEDFEPDLGAITGIVAFATGETGRRYMLDRDGELFEIILG